MAKGKYKDWLRADKLLQLTAWARDGLTDGQIAHNIGITASTLYDWKNRYPEISEALKKGKEVVALRSKMPCSSEHWVTNIQRRRSKSTTTGDGQPKP